MTDDLSATKEATVKDWIKEVLDAYNVYYFMPVNTGYGAAGVDFHCVVKWQNMALAFFIEAKRFGEEPTNRQTQFLDDRRKHQNANTFIIDGMAGCQALKQWLKKLTNDNGKHEGYGDD